MAKRKIIWSKSAKHELKSILQFYLERNRNNRYSLKLLKEVEEVSVLIQNYESIGRLTTDKTVRVIPLGYFLIFYRVRQNQIEILSFWDNRQMAK